MSKKRNEVEKPEEVSGEVVEVREISSSRSITNLFKENNFDPVAELLGRYKTLDKWGKKLRRQQKKGTCELKEKDFFNLEKLKIGVLNKLIEHEHEETDLALKRKSVNHRTGDFQNEKEEAEVTGYIIGGYKEVEVNGKKIMVAKNPQKVHMGDSN